MRKKGKLNSSSKNDKYRAYNVKGKIKQTSKT